MFNMMELWSTKSLSMVKIVCDWCWIHSRIWGTWECKGRGDCALSKRQSRSQSSTAWRTRPCSRHRYMTCDTLVCACSTVSVPRHHHIDGWHAVPESSCFHHCCMMFHIIVPFKTKRPYFSVWFYFWMTSDSGNSKVEWSGDSVFRVGWFYLLCTFCMFVLFCCCKYKFVRNFRNGLFLLWKSVLEHSLCSTTADPQSFTCTGDDLFMSVFMGLDLRDPLLQCRSVIETVFECCLVCPLIVSSWLIANHAFKIISLSEVTFWWLNIVRFCLWWCQLYFSHICNQLVDSSMVCIPNILSGGRHTLYDIHWHVNLKSLLHFVSLCSSLMMVWLPWQFCSALGIFSTIDLPAGPFD